MLKVKTIVKESSIHGVGLFADQFIPKDSLIFEEDEFSIKFKENEVDRLSQEQKDFIDRYCYLREDTWFCSMDNDRFTNHSETPNVYETETQTYALVDILPGEEILTNYKNICKDWESKI